MHGVCYAGGLCAERKRGEADGKRTETMDKERGKAPDADDRGRENVQGDRRGAGTHESERTAARTLHEEGRKR